MAIEFKGRWFAKEVILQCIRWYLAYKLSYRDLEEMMSERGLRVDHSTIQRWVTRYSAALEAQFRRGKRPVGGSWRMDETYIRVKGDWKYLYRAVDRFCRKLCDTLPAGLPERKARAPAGLHRKVFDRACIGG